MEFIFGTLMYLGLSAVAGVAADTRGRFGIGWFVISLLISPLIGGLLVLVLPRLGRNGMPEIRGVFEPEGVLGGIPYRAAPRGMIEAMTKGGLVRFQNMDQFRAAAEGRDVVRAVDLDFPETLDGIRYRSNSNDTITAITPATPEDSAWVFIKRSQPFSFLQ